MPWHLPEEFRFFKRMTLGGTVLMGQKTFEALGGPLPGRRNLVVSRKPVAAEGVEWVADLASYEPEGDVWVIGGAEVYRAMLPRCEEVYLSVIQREVEGETMMPEFEAQFPVREKVMETPEFTVWRYARR